MGKQISMMLQRKGIDDLMNVVIFVIITLLIIFLLYLAGIPFLEAVKNKASGG